MARKREISPRQPSESELLAKEAAIRENFIGFSRLNQTLCHERAERLVEWIQQNRPDLTFGVVGQQFRIADDDRYGLSDLEDYGRAGDAVMLHENDTGQIWWCDPEGRTVDQHKFLLFINGPHGNASYLIRFTRT